MTERLDALLHEAAARRPQDVAVSCGEERLDYAGLEGRATALAAALRRAGAGPGERVALALDKSVDAVVAVFGALGSGAAWLPLDPQGPVERARRIVADCAPRVLVAASPGAPRLQALLAAPTPIRSVVVPGGDGDVGGGGASSLGDTSRDGASLAYVLGTSGSTGRPKGVAVSHRAALAFVEWAAAAFELSRSDVVAWQAPLQFDLSVFDLFATVRAGARICVAPPGTSAFPASLAELLERERVTTCYATPSALMRLSRHGDLGRRDLSALRQVLFAGEPFPAPRLRELMQQLPRARFHNLYGPTETNVCTWHPLEGPPAGDAPLPIGRPCAGDDVEVLGEDGTPVPPGAIGELAVGGPTLMDGYWNDAAATRQVLRRDRSGTLRCFTGDLGRCRPDGVLEFHGRRDAMIKTRGWRVEPGEIEAALHEHPAVEEALVVPVADEELGHRIHAAVVVGAGRAVDEPELQRFCAERLPACMRPETIAVLRGPLPRTPSGKLDRQAIAAGLGRGA